MKIEDIFLLMEGAKFSNYNITNYENIPGFSTDMRIRQFKVGTTVVLLPLTSGESKTSESIYKHVPVGTKLRVLGKTIAPSGLAKSDRLIVNPIGSSDVYCVHQRRFVEESIANSDGDRKIYTTTSNYKDTPGFTENMGKRFSIGQMVEIGGLAETVPLQIKKYCPNGTICKVLGRREVSTNVNTIYTIAVNPMDTPYVFFLQGWYLHEVGKVVDKKRFPKARGETITCLNCGINFPTSMPDSNRVHRNHCPECLCSVHVDIKPGDRLAWCGTGDKGTDNWIPSILRPVGKTDQTGSLTLVSKCEKCGAIKNVKTSSDDNHQLFNRLPNVKILTKGNQNVDIVPNE